MVDLCCVLLHLLPLLLLPLFLLYDELITAGLSMMLLITFNRIFLFSKWSGKKKLYFPH